jgi:hypothetical protein
MMKFSNQKIFHAHLLRNHDLFIYDCVLEDTPTGSNFCVTLHLPRRFKLTKEDEEFLRLTSKDIFDIEAFLKRKALNLSVIDEGTELQHFDQSQSHGDRIPTPESQEITPTLAESVSGLELQQYGLSLPISQDHTPTQGEEELGVRSPQEHQEESILAENNKTAVRTSPEPVSTQVRETKERKTTSRPFSPPWKKVTVEGPTWFVEGGRRKSARRNTVPVNAPQDSDTEQSSCIPWQTNRLKGKHASKRLYQSSSRKTSEQSETNPQCGMEELRLPMRKAITSAETRAESSSTLSGLALSENLEDEVLNFRIRKNEISVARTTAERDARLAAVKDILPPVKKKYPVPAGPPGVQFYKSVSKRVLKEGEMLAESDDEIDETWLRQRHRAEINSAEVNGLLITDFEKEFILKHDEHMMNERPIGRKEYQKSLIRFCRNNATWLNGEEMRFQLGMFVGMLVHTKRITARDREDLFEIVDDSRLRRIEANKIFREQMIAKAVSRRKQAETAMEMADLPMVELDGPNHDIELSDLNSLHEAPQEDSRV